jgi:phage anti-repressor protein
MEITKLPIDIKTLINTSTLEIYNKNRFIDKLQEHFSEEEQRLYVCNLFLFLNYHPINDYIINLEDVYKMIGFANKGNAMKTIKSNFVVDEDYKVVIFHNEKAAFPCGKVGPSNEEVIFRKEKNLGGRPTEKIMLNIETFKNLCMIAKTDNGKKIRRYYVKMENVYNDLMKEELEEKKIQLEEQQKKIEILQNKPETEGFHVKAGYIYLIRDSSSIGSYKIGLGENPDRRLITLNISSSQKSLKMVEMFKTNNMKYAERIIHILLEPFRIKKRNEWFYLSSDIDLNYVIHVIKTSIQMSDKLSFSDYNLFNAYAENLPKFVLDEQDIIVEQAPKYTNGNFLSKPEKISLYNGVSWSISKNKWTARLTKNNDTIFLGDYEIEKEAAIAYNDYASYLNLDSQNLYRLNELVDYTPNPRNIPVEMKKIKLENKTSKFTGVYFIKSKQLFEASISYKKKGYKLIKHSDDLECAKVYNEQALYFNNNLGTNYTLNDIVDFTTIEKNHVYELELNKIRKYSRFTGVSIRNDSDKFRAYIKHNGKRIDCGTFKDEIDAAKAYNKKATELNELETTKIKYTLNEID